MKLKINTLAIFALTLVIVLSHTHTVLAQNYDWCDILAYVTDLVNENEILSFTVLDPPVDSGITNELHAEINDEDVEFPISPGDTVVVNYQDVEVTISNLIPHITEGTYVVTWSGEANSVTINAVEIPEFPSFLTIPLFISATLLAVIVFRRKQISKKIK